MQYQYNVEKISPNPAGSKLEFSNYLDDILNILEGDFAVNPRQVKIIRQFEPTYLTPRSAFYCELIVAELVINSLKHAFTGKHHGEIRVIIESMHGKDLMIEITDNGIGLPKGFKLEEATSFGFKFLRKLVRELNGQMRVNNEHGTSFILNFSDSVTKNHRASM